jgi:hypothetical protein
VLEEPPFVKITFVYVGSKFVESVEKQRRIGRIGRREESRDSVAVRARTHCKETFF